MATLRLPLLLSLAALGLPGMALAQAQTSSPQPPQGAASKPGLEYRGNGEQVTAHGRHSLPPGYQEAPNVDFKHGPDPDHEANIQRDPITGTDLTQFGSAYQSASPVQTGTLGDTNGNGWIAPH
ncbi:hypothetical protein [Acidomonas methanolica]|uniref:Uncharacterized protein n=1 Tax=Acidomonas methanolica NBRC 104435 TaxID=1231351 RepID=A0A023D1P9_ACIMT|nr:hypothetical protein [Acidomonas methanolica]MBU2654574.1 hypothetical protein [Acidomonas methanolica]TCS27447.1 hypothetical protein EDC31_11051 [Acidomonas methanolica]GAJ28072.1 hypothetical protein Amme_013_036 [Acidomonas methanolica NBRC 104435]GBQ51797.1 hypothetical protein AA0498_1579 [Acidomonas methanolica]GEK98646.1 hypothetical protein AME01nite_11450 [Acidomonas methanolica NBRC 104435]